MLLDIQAPTRTVTHHTGPPGVAHSSRGANNATDESLTGFFPLWLALIISSAAA